MRAFRRSIIGAASLLSIVACAETTANSTSFSAKMRGESEVPAVVTTATGTATFAVSGTDLTYTVTWTGLSGNAVASHIHVGTPAATGSVRLNLCGAGAAPACPTGASASITGTATAAYLSGMTMDVLLENLRNFGAYANVHTTANSGGEIRGQILGVPAP